MTVNIKDANWRSLPALIGFDAAGKGGKMPIMGAGATARLPGYPAVMSAPPTVTVGAAGAATSISGGVSRVFPTDPAFTVSGTFNGGAYVDNPIDIGSTRFMTDSDVFELDFDGVFTGSRVSVFVDGRPVAATTQVINTGASERRKIAYTFASYKPREILVIYDSSARLKAVIIKPNAIMLKTRVVGPRHLFITDSMGTKSYPGPDGLLSYPWIAGLSAGLADFAAEGVVGDGYVAGGPVSTRLARIIAYAPNVLHMLLGYNDGSQNAAAVGTACATFVDNFLAGCPNSSVVLYGPLQTGNGQVAAPVTAAILGVATGRPKVRAVDTSLWFSGTGNSVTPNNTGNRDRTNLGDNTHPTPYGGDYLGFMVAGEIAKASLL